MKITSLVLSISTLLGLVASTPTNRPVCIVGAGPAGLIAANRLESKGRKVVIFEKQDEVGGKCQAVYDKDTYHPLGALLFSNGTYVETLKVIEKSGVLSVPFVTGQRWLYNSTSGFVVPSPPVSAAFATLVGQEFQRYAVYWTTIFAPYSGLRYKNGVPAEFTVPAAEWLSKNNFQALHVLFVQAMVSFGYGDLREVPILYLLQYLTPDILGFFAGVHGVYLIDFHKVFVRFAKNSIKSQIRLNTDITEIDRSGRFPVISYKKDRGGKRDNYERHGTKKEECSHVILAFPPTIDALKEARLRVSEDEKKVFSPIGIHDYFSGAVRLNSPPDLTFASISSAPNLPTTPTGEPIFWLKLFSSSNIATSWSWGPYRGGTTTRKAYRLLKETLSKFNRDPRDGTSAPTPVKDRDVLGFQQHDYFPHFDSEQLKNGWYAKFNDLQGKKNTYYASGLNGFETVEFALRAGIDIVDSFF